MEATAALNLTEWGWKVHDGKYIPVLIHTDVAPADILKVACCKCSAESKKPFGTWACLCVKYGLSCITACKHCNGETCEIAQKTVVNEEAAEADVLDSAVEGFVDDDCVEYYIYKLYFARMAARYKMQNTSIRKVPVKHRELKKEIQR